MFLTLCDFLNFFCCACVGGWLHAPTHRYPSFLGPTVYTVQAPLPIGFRTATLFNKDKLSIGAKQLTNKERRAERQLNNQKYQNSKNSKNEYIYTKDDRNYAIF